MFDDKIIFITGYGSIGQALFEKVLQYNIHSVRVFDNNELKIHELEQQFKNTRKVIPILGDIRDKNQLQIAMKRADIVIHTAAYKHVSTCQKNVREAKKTNVDGTENVVDVSIDGDIEQAVCITTDKAVNPICAMGATKLLAEQELINSMDYRLTNNIILSSVRFGNVFGSSGSVVSIFKQQIQEHKPLTITDVEMTRFVMKLDEAVDLIFNAMNLSAGGKIGREIFILKMSSIKIIDLAKVMNRLYGRDENNFICIGREHGEKLHEELMTMEESRFALENDKMIVIPPKTLIDYYKSLGFKEIKPKSYSSKDNIFLSLDEIRKLL